jgi:hypothetical protein
MVVDHLLDDPVESADDLSVAVELEDVAQQRRHLVCGEGNASGVSVGQQVELPLPASSAFLCQSRHLFPHHRQQVLSRVVICLAEASPLLHFLSLHDHVSQSQVALVPQPANLVAV